jgi:hypothetical protein
MQTRLFKLITLAVLFVIFTALLHWIGGSAWSFSAMYGLLFAASGIVVASFVAQQRGER